MRLKATPKKIVDNALTRPDIPIIRSTEAKMKYNAKQLSSGKWAVWAGSKYYTDTLTDDQQGAIDEALIWSAQWYQVQRDKCELALIENGHFERNPLIDFGDYLC